MTDKPDLTRVWALGAPSGNIIDPDLTTPGKFAAGWQAEVPPFEHFNFIQKLQTQGLAHINEQGIAVWDDFTTYPVGGLAKGSDGNVYKALVSQNDNDPVSDDGTNWIDELSNRVIRVTSIAAMEAYSAPVGFQFSLSDDLRGGLFVVKSGTPPDDPQKGVYIPLANGNYAERKDIGIRVQLGWFYSGDWDDAVDAAYNYLEENFGGGIIELSDTDTYIRRSHVFLSSILIDGVFPVEGRTLYIADEITAFKFGQTSPVRLYQIGLGVINCLVRGEGAVRGNVADVYGNPDPAFGFTTTTSSTSGALDSTNSNKNITSTFAFFSCVYGPVYCYGNNVEGVGRAFVCGQNFAYEIKNNIISGCTIGVEISNVTTTITLRMNNIQLNAIGVFVKYASSFITIEENVIEANYAGCDIFCFNNPNMLDITKNYFEASPQNIVFKADSNPPFIPSNVRISKNVGVSLYCKYGAINNITLESNGLGSATFNTFAYGYLKNIVFKNNTEGQSLKAFNPNNISLNFQAAKSAHEVILISDEISPQHIISTGSVRGFELNQRKIVTNAAATFEIPNLKTDLVAKITVMKFSSTVDSSQRVAEYILGLSRQVDGDTLFDIIELNQTNIPLYARDISTIEPPTITLSGSSTSEQEVLVNVQSNGPGGDNTGLSHLTTVEYISNLPGIIVK